MPCRPAMMFWSIVGQARRHTAGPMGPSTIERSNCWTGFSAGADIRFGTGLRGRGSAPDDYLETAVRHPLHVERHRLRVHHRLQTRVLHHLRVDPISVSARLVDDPGEDDRLARLGLRQAGKAPARFQVIPYGFDVVEGAVLAPHLT